jgi:hypothetical protein
MNTAKNTKTTNDSAQEFSKSNLAASISYIPEKDSNFVPFGFYDEVEMIIGSNNFFTFQIAGLSGCGKTFQIEQACANTRRELVRAPITVETDEDSLIGHYVLENGETKFQYGPVVVAMLRGAILLLDEIDKASSKIMCIQPVLEGKPLLIKKTNEVIYPAKGFNVCSTANTKGQGDETGKYITSNHLDEAMLERFAIAFDADFPDPEVEKEIIGRVLKQHSISDNFGTHLSTWASNIRLTNKQGDESEVISTRRLVHIANAYAIMTGGTDRLKAIKRCLTRFNPDVAEGWLAAYTAIDSSINAKKMPKKSADLGKAAFGPSTPEDEHPWSS